MLSIWNCLTWLLEDLFFKYITSWELEWWSFLNIAYPNVASRNKCTRKNAEEKQTDAENKQQSTTCCEIILKKTVITDEECKICPNNINLNAA